MPTQPLRLGGGEPGLVGAAPDHLVHRVPGHGLVSHGAALVHVGVSRPTLIKLLGDDQIAYERIGTHRRIQLRDLLAYREQRRAAQYAALAATSSPIDDEEDAETVLASLRQARKVIAQRRREQAD